MLTPSIDELNRMRTEDTIINKIHRKKPQYNVVRGTISQVLSIQTSEHHCQICFAQPKHLSLHQEELFHVYL